MVFANAPPVITVTGHITDRVGLPVQGVSVYVDNNQSQVFTDGNGFYSLQMQSGMHTLGINGGSSISQYLPNDGFDIKMVSAINLNQNTILDMQLPGNLVTVHVQDPTQSPVANANVTIAANLGTQVGVQTSIGSLGFSGGSKFSGVMGKSHGATNSAGDIVLPSFPVNVNVTVVSPVNTFSNASLTQSITQDTSVSITLQNVPVNVSISGQITDRTGNPVEGVTVYIDNNNQSQVVTDNNGFYSLQALTGSHKLGIKGSSFSSYLPNSNFNIQMGNVINFTNDTTLDMQLPGSLITVHVQDVVQNPIANAHVTITNNELGTPIAVQTSIGPIQFGGGNSSGGNMGNSVGSTDSAGNITLPFFPINVRITVVPSGNILASTFVNKSVPQDTSTTITLQNIPVTISISGHITDRTGSPLTGVAIYLDNNQSQVSTDNNGFYSIQFQSGLHTLGVKGNSSSSYLPNNGFDIKMINAINFTQSTTFDMQLPGNTMIIHVQDPSQNPVANTNVTIAANLGTQIPVQSSLGSLPFGGGSTFSGVMGKSQGSTDNTGNITLPTFPVHVNIVITPPGGSNFIPFSTNMTVSNDTTQVFSLQIPNQAPAVNQITIATSPVQINNGITATAAFTDPGISDTHTAIWNWGDGTTSNGNVTENNGSGTVQNNHTYTTAGVYTIIFTVTDNHEGEGTAQYQYVVVYDSSAGFLTGSGKYNDQTGEVKFGIQAKYQNGNTPTGKTKLHIKTQDIDFESTAYQWLVVNGSKATLKGNGTINGAGNYTFLISVIDGNQDFVRIKITDNANTIIYDTQPNASDTADPTTLITNGSIKIH